VGKEVVQLSKKINGLRQGEGIFAPLKPLRAFLSGALTQKNFSVSDHAGRGRAT